MFIFFVFIYVFYIEPQAAISCQELFDKYALPAHDPDRGIIRQMTSDCLKDFFLEEMFVPISSIRASRMIARSSRTSPRTEHSVISEVVTPRFFQSNPLNVHQFQNFIENFDRFALPSVRKTSQNMSERLNKYFISCAKLRPELCENIQELFKQINHESLQNCVHCLQIPIDVFDDEIVIRLKNNSELNNNQTGTKLHLNHYNLSEFLEEYSKFTKLPSQILLFISESKLRNEILKKLFQMINDLLGKLFLKFFSKFSNFYIIFSYKIVYFPDGNGRMYKF